MHYIATHRIGLQAERCYAWQPGDKQTSEPSEVTCGHCRALGAALERGIDALVHTPPPNFDDPRAVMRALVDRLTPAAELELERRRAAALELVRTDANYEAFLGATYEAVRDGH